MLHNTLTGTSGQRPSNAALLESATTGTVRIRNAGRARYTDQRTIHDRPVIDVTTGHHRGNTPLLDLKLAGSAWYLRWYLWHPSIPTGNGERRWLLDLGTVGLTSHQTSSGNAHLQLTPRDIAAAEIAAEVSGTAQAVGQWLRIEMHHRSGALTVRVYPGHATDRFHQYHWPGRQAQADVAVTGFRFRRRTTLVWGNTGSAVRELQRELISLGYSLGAGGDDGIFGDATFFAVRDFQRSVGLTPDDGVPGSETRAAIDVARGLTFPSLLVSHLAADSADWVGPEPGPPPPPVPSPTSYLSLGMRA